MKIGPLVRLKEYIWSGLYKLTNNYSTLTVNNLGNGYIKCLWNISSIDNWRIDFSKSCFCAIRIFDISNKRSKNNSTCIMKEIQVSKYQCSITFPIPINKGMYYFEFGYRKKNGEWRNIACQDLNLGYRIKKVIHRFDHDDWFNSKIIIRNKDISSHEKAYQISVNKRIGGSEISSYKG